MCDSIQEEANNNKTVIDMGNNSSTCKIQCGCNCYKVRAIVLPVTANDHELSQATCALGKHCGLWLDISQSSVSPTFRRLRHHLCNVLQAVLIGPKAVLCHGLSKTVPD